MSDGLSDLRREEEAGVLVARAARRLAEAFDELYDPMFGRLPTDALEIVNQRIARYGVAIVETEH